MPYTVTLYFDNMVDATYYFETHDKALVCQNRLKQIYQGRRFYQVKMEKVT